MSSLTTSASLKEAWIPLSSGKLILVIDDRPDICDMLRQALTLNGYRVTTSPGGDAWIDHAMQSGDPPSLVLLDLSDPTMDRVAFLHSLRAQWQAAPPIIVLTTNKQIYDELTTVERVICKPFHVRDLLAEIQRGLSLSFR
jgi:DNA-binding response OmpR family regulator